MYDRGLDLIEPLDLSVNRWQRFDPDGAQQTGRRAFLLEFDLLYRDVIVQRYEQFTGQKAERLRAACVSAA